MKKKFYTRPVCVMLPQEMYKNLAAITNECEISMSDYIRIAVQDRLRQAILITKKEE